MIWAGQVLVKCEMLLDYRGAKCNGRGGSQVSYRMIGKPNLKSRIFVLQGSDCKEVYIAVWRWVFGIAMKSAILPCSIPPDVSTSRAVLISSSVAIPVDSSTRSTGI